MKKLTKNSLFLRIVENFFNILSVCHVKDTMTLHSNDNDDDAKKKYIFCTFGDCLGDISQKKKKFYL